MKKEIYERTGEYYIAIYVENNKMIRSANFPTRKEALEFMDNNTNKWFLGIYTTTEEEDA